MSTKSFYFYTHKISKKGILPIDEIWNADAERYREINLCAEYPDRPMAELAAILLREMARLHNLENDIQDVSSNGYYHNMKFKAATEANGLHIEKHYEDRKNHSKIEGRGSGMPYSRGQCLPQCLKPLKMYALLFLKMW